MYGKDCICLILFIYFYFIHPSDYNNIPHTPIHTIENQLTTEEGRKGRKEGREGKKEGKKEGREERRKERRKGGKEEGKKDKNLKIYISNLL